MFRYRVDFDRPGIPNRNAIVPRGDFQRVTAGEPVGVYAKPTGDRLHAIVEVAKEDEAEALEAALKLCAEADSHFYKPGVLP